MRFFYVSCLSDSIVAHYNYLMWRAPVRAHKRNDQIQILSNPFLLLLVPPASFNPRVLLIFHALVILLWLLPCWTSRWPIYRYLCNFDSVVGFTEIFELLLSFPDDQSLSEKGQSFLSNLYTMPICLTLPLYHFHVSQMLMLKKQANFFFFSQTPIILHSIIVGKIFLLWYRALIGVWYWKQFFPHINISICICLNFKIYLFRGF